MVGQRRPVFIGGVMIAAFAACLQGVAIVVDHFALFCAASLALGIAHGCANYRWCGADCATEVERPKAIICFGRRADGGVIWPRNCPHCCGVGRIIFMSCYFSVSAAQLISLLALAG